MIDSKMGGIGGAGYKLMFMDDCWSATERDSSGNLMPDKERFPHGLLWLSRYLKKLNLHLGVYLCIGTKTCRKGRPGSFGYYKQDADWVASQEIDYVKIDNCHRPSGYTEKELFTNFSRHFNATGRPIFLDACIWGRILGKFYYQAARLQMDHLPFFWLPTKAAGKGVGQGTWQIIEYFATLPRNFTAPFFLGDPDFLMTLFKPFKSNFYTMNFMQSRTEFSFWALWGAPMLCATTLSNMTKEKRSILLNRAVLEIGRDSLQSPGYRVFSSKMSSAELWVKELSDTNTVAVILYNNKVFRSDPVNVTVTWADWGFLPSNSLIAEDLWENAPLPPTKKFSVTGNYSKSLVPTDIQMLKITCTPGPCLKKI